MLLHRRFAAPDRIGVSDAVQQDVLPSVGFGLASSASAYGAVAGGCEKCGLTRKSPFDVEILDGERFPGLPVRIPVTTLARQGAAM